MRDRAADAAILDGLWYFAAPARDLAPGKMTRRTLFGEPVVLGRTKAGAPFALRDVCPHRGAPLSAGRVEDGVVACPYHGWRFRIADGACAAIPALADDPQNAASKVRVRRHPVYEANGLLWIYWGDGEPPAPPDIGISASFRPKIIARTAAEGPYDEAVIGLVDPAHTPFVHRQWWWREGAGFKEKSKRFEPTALGFRMPAHPPSSNSRIYRLLGGAPTTEIEFRLPGVRIETIRVKTRRVIGLTAITPAETGRSDIVHALFWDFPLLDALRPVLSSMARDFLAQDGAILSAQNRNLSRLDHRPLYVGDPDEPAKWYMSLKRAWALRAETGGFVNPVSGGTLRWRT